jgi:hypothetical protein
VSDYWLDYDREMKLRIENRRKVFEKDRERLKEFFANPWVVELILKKPINQFLVNNPNYNSNAVNMDAVYRESKVEIEKVTENLTE